MVTHTMKIALVFRSGGDYNASDVQWLVNQLPKDYEIIYVIFFYVCSAPF